MPLYTLRSLSRRIRRTWLRVFLIYFAILLARDFYHLLASLPPERVPITRRPPPGERYFIASMHWNNEAILRSHWVRAVAELVEYLGPENTYTSVIESGSWDNSKDALRKLKHELVNLNAPHNIVLDETTHLDEISRIPGENEPGWVWTSRGQKELRRIPYLSRIRNAVMEDMMNLNNTGDRPFTKVLWLNDVIFTTEDIVTLLDTRSGSYASACSLDFSKPPVYYDTFALRDIDGNKPITQTWPYFLSSVSRHNLVANKPVPVQSCWNGVIAMDADPFYANPPLRFRGLPDSLAPYHLEGSECCLIHADNPLTFSKGVWLNPNVRVGYNPDAYEIVKASSNRDWPSVSARMKGLWKNRIARITGAPSRNLERLAVARRLRKWQAKKTDTEPERQEYGVNCIINEMQVLIKNGWKHL